MFIQKLELARASGLKADSTTLTSKYHTLNRAIGLKYNTSDIDTSSGLKAK